MFQAIANFFNVLAIRIPFVLLNNVEEILNGMKDRGVSGSLTSLDEKIDEIGSSAYHLSFKVIMYYAVLAVMFAAGGFLIAKGAVERDEQKKKLVYIIIGIILAGGAVALVIAVANASSDII